MNSPARAVVTCSKCGATPHEKCRRAAWLPCRGPFRDDSRSMATTSERKLKPTSFAAVPSSELRLVPTLILFVLAGPLSGGMFLAGFGAVIPPVLIGSYVLGIVPAFLTGMFWAMLGTQPSVSTWLRSLLTICIGAASSCLMLMLELGPSSRIGSLTACGIGAGAASVCCFWAFMLQISRGEKV
jgi:uncharacterized membrane protein YeaQ/YmgE (transglycosylase-associated protein family)